MENLDIDNNPIFIALLIIFEIFLIREVYRGWRFTTKEQDKTIIAWEHAPSWWPFQELSLRYFKSRFYFWIIRLMPLFWLFLVSALLIAMFTQILHRIFV